MKDVAVIGGGIVGMATAAELVARGRDVVVLEAEAKLGEHQTGRNSGVIHSGIYYKPGSFKARLCAEGREAMFRFCEEHVLRTSAAARSSSRRAPTSSACSTSSIAAVARRLDPVRMTAEGD